jgi:hypothetical protein
VAFALPLWRSRRRAASLLAQLQESERQGLIERRFSSTTLVMLLIILGLGALYYWTRSRILAG